MLKLFKGKKNESENQILYSEFCQICKKNGFTKESALKSFKKSFKKVFDQYKDVKIRDAIQPTAYMLAGYAKEFLIKNSYKVAVAYYNAGFTDTAKMLVATNFFEAGFKTVKSVKVAKCWYDEEKTNITLEQIKMAGEFFKAGFKTVDSVEVAKVWRDKKGATGSARIKIAGEFFKAGFNTIPLSHYYSEGDTVEKIPLYKKYLKAGFKEERDFGFVHKYINLGFNTIESVPVAKMFFDASQGKSFEKMSELAGEYYKGGINTVGRVKRVLKSFESQLSADVAVTNAGLFPIIAKKEEPKKSTNKTVKKEESKKKPTNKTGWEADKEAWKKAKWKNMNEAKKWYDRGWKDANIKNSAVIARNWYKPKGAKKPVWKFPTEALKWSKGGWKSVNSAEALKWFDHSKWKILIESSLKWFNKGWRNCEVAWDWYRGGWAKYPEPAKDWSYYSWDDIEVALKWFEESKWHKVEGRIVYKWYKNGWKDVEPEISYSWYKSDWKDVDPEKAHNWYKNGWEKVGPVCAFEWFDDGWEKIGPEIALNWYKSGWKDVSGEEAYDYYEKDVNPGEAFLEYRETNSII